MFAAAAPVCGIFSGGFRGGTRGVMGVFGVGLNARVPGMPFIWLDGLVEEVRARESDVCDVVM